MVCYEDEVSGLQAPKDVLVPQPESLLWDVGQDYPANHGTVGRQAEEGSEGHGKRRTRPCGWL